MADVNISTSDAITAIESLDSYVAYIVTDYTLETFGMARLLINGLKNNHAGPMEPCGTPATGTLWYDTTNLVLKKYTGSAWTEINSNVGAAPVGSIVFWLGGYMTDGSNAGYTYVLGSANTVAGANAYFNTYGYWVADGSAPNQSLSSIWSAADRYLPNLTDDRFLMGLTACGSIGGKSANSHTHPIDPPETATGATSDFVTITGLVPSTGIATETHTHDVNVASFTSGAANDTENRPLYLAGFYIVRVL